MIWQDIVNASFEAFAVGAVVMHISTLLKDRSVRGVSIAGTAFFVGWGAWNLYYYNHLNQTFSAAVAIGVTVANVAYLILMLKYRERASGSESQKLGAGETAGTQP